MIPFIIQGISLSGVYCSDNPDMVLVNKDLFKKKHDRLETLENAEKARIEERKKAVALGLNSNSTADLVAFAKVEELCAENARLREQIGSVQNSNISLLDKNNGFLVELNEQANQLSELEALRKDKDMLMQVNKELADKVASLEGTISELQEQVRLMGREPIEVARASKSDIAIDRAADVLVMAINKKSVCDINNSYNDLRKSSIYSIISVKKPDDYDRLMRIFHKKSSFFFLNHISEEKFVDWYRKKRKAELHLQTGSELEKKLGAGFESIKGVVKDPTTGYYRVEGIVC